MFVCECDSQKSLSAETTEERTVESSHLTKSTDNLTLVSQGSDRDILPTYLCSNCHALPTYTWPQ